MKLRLRRREPPPRCMDCPAPATVGLLLNGLPAGWFCDAHDQANRELHDTIMARLKEAAAEPAPERIVVSTPQDELAQAAREQWARWAEAMRPRNVSPAPVIVPPADPQHDPDTCGMCRPRPRPPP